MGVGPLRMSVNLSFPASWQVADSWHESAALAVVGHRLTAVRVWDIRGWKRSTLRISDADCQGTHVSACPGVLPDLICLPSGPGRWRLAHSMRTAGGVPMPC